MELFRCACARPDVNGESAAAPCTAITVSRAAKQPVSSGDMLATCGSCGHKFDGSEKTCPRCGSDGRSITPSISDGLGITDDREMVHHERSGPGGTLALPRREITDADGGGLKEGSVRHAQNPDSEAIHVYRNDEQVAEGRTGPGDDSVELEMKGRSPQNEEHTARAARILMERFINDGHACGSLRVEGHQDADCDLEFDGCQRRLQVTRAEQTLWRPLADEGHVRRNDSIERVAAGIRAAVEKKAQCLTREQQANLTLVLDATFAADAVLERVIAFYCVEQGEWTASLGFDEVWIVGPTSEATYRLDTRWPGHQGGD
jgi:hypothetical protein